jgi:hypothetical protein
MNIVIANQKQILLFITFKIIFIKLFEFLFKAITIVVKDLKLVALLANYTINQINFGV